MPAIRFTQDPLGITANSVASTSTTTRRFIQNHLTTSKITTIHWFPPEPTTANPTKVDLSTVTPIQTLMTSLLYREPSDTRSAISYPAPTNPIGGEPSTNVHASFFELGKLAVSPYHLMYIVAVCVCFVILMSFCCCTDDVGRYIRAKNKSGATVQAAPVWPAALQFMDGTNDADRRDETTRGHSTVRAPKSQALEGSGSPGPSTIPQNPFTKITIKTCEEGHESIIIDEIELQNIPMKTSRDGSSNNTTDFTHEYVTANPQAPLRNGKVSLRGGSGAKGELSDSFMRTGAITSFKETEERWKPTWSATKSLFGTRRREKGLAIEEMIGQPVSGTSTQPDVPYAPPYKDASQSTTNSKRARRQTDTSVTAFSFPMSDGSDSEISRFLTFDRIKQKLRPLIHSVSRQSLRERFSSTDHSRDYSAEGTDLDEVAYSETVKKALRRARSSASVPFGLFKLPDPARDDPGASVAGPVSIMAHDSASYYSDTASETTEKARSPVGTLLGVKSKERPGRGPESHHNPTSSRRIVSPTDSMRCVVDEQDFGAAKAFNDMRRYEEEMDMKRERSIRRERDLGSSVATASERDNRGKNEAKDTIEEEGLVKEVRNDEIEEAGYVPCRSINNGREECDGDEEFTAKEEQSDVTNPSYMNSTRSGHVSRSRKRGQTAMSYHFHARRTRAEVDSTDSSGALLFEKREKMKGKLGLLMIRGVASGDGKGVGARRGGKVEWVTMDLGGGD